MLCAGTDPHHASQKNHLALYLFSLYCEEAEVERFAEAWKKTGHKLDMGKSCVRFKKIEDVPLEVIGKTVKRMTVKKFVKAYEESLNAPRPTQKKVASKKKAMSKKKVTSKTPTR